MGSCYCQASCSVVEWLRVVRGSSLPPSLTPLPPSLCGPDCNCLPSLPFSQLVLLRFVAVVVPLQAAIVVVAVLLLAVIATLVVMLLAVTLGLLLAWREGGVLVGVHDVRERLQAACILIGNPRASASE